MPNPQKIQQESLTNQILVVAILFLLFFALIAPDNSVAIRLGVIAIVFQLFRIENTLKHKLKSETGN